MANVSAPNFSGSVVNLEALKEHTSSELLDLLDNVRGKKALVMDPDLTGPLGLVIDVALLKVRSCGWVVLWSFGGWRLSSYFLFFSLFSWLAALPCCLSPF